MSINDIKYQKLFCSVIMPVHNGEKYLREAIESVLNQTYSNFEFLMIENCSTDSSFDIIKSYDDPRIRLIIEEDCGQVQAYNRGFQEAKGEFIFIHDQDDISDPQRFQKQLKCMLLNDIDICGSNFYIIDKSGQIIGEIKTPHGKSEIVKQLPYKNSAIFNSSVCLKINVVIELKGFNQSYFPSADYEFYLRGLNIFKYENIDESLYYWRQHNEQISNKYLNNITNTTIKISRKFSYLFPKGMKYTYIGLIYYYNNKLIISFLYFLISLIKDIKSKILFRYLIIVIFAGIPLKLIRKMHLLNSPFFLTAKQKFDSFF